MKLAVRVGWFTRYKKDTQAAVYHSVRGETFAFALSEFISQTELSKLIKTKQSAKQTLFLRAAIPFQTIFRHQTGEEMFMRYFPPRVRSNSEDETKGFKYIHI